LGSVSRNGPNSYWTVFLLFDFCGRPSLLVVTHVTLAPDLVLSQTARTGTPAWTLFERIQVGHGARVCLFVQFDPDLFSSPLPLIEAL